MPSDSDAPSRGGATPGPGLPGTGRPDAGMADDGLFFAAIGTSRMPMVLSDPNRPDNPIVFANDAFLSLTGYDRAEVVGRNCRFLQGPETDPETVERIRHAVRTRTDIATEMLNYRRDGTAFWNALFISPVLDRDGRLAFFFASQLDVSRRRDAEEAVHQAQRMEAVGQLTGGIAHDFNNLLQVVTGYMDGVKDHVAASGDPRLIRQVGAMAEAAGRATALTQQLLAFSRKQTLRGRAVSLNDLVAGMGERLGRALGDRATIVTRLDPALWNSRLDPGQAEAAILALVANARDAMPDGGTLTIGTANCDVGAGDPLSGSLAPGRYGALSLSDTGSGMPESVLKRVMDPFFTTKPEGRGSGLGLSMVYGFARQSGGAVRIESAVGTGTTVRLYLPAAETDAAPPAPAARPDAGPGGGERILVVDDRAEVAELARTMLEDGGYTVEVARDGEDALAKLAGGFDLLFSDLIMPGSLNGVSLAREAQRRYPGLKVLLTTGFAESGIDRTDSGGADFATIAKPYRRANLARTVRAVLDAPARAG